MESEGAVVNAISSVRAIALCEQGRSRWKGSLISLVSGYHSDANFAEMRRVRETLIFARPLAWLVPGLVENRASALHRAPGVSFATRLAFRRNTR